MTLLVGIEQQSDCNLFSFSIQTIGLGGMKPNTVIAGWPYSWRQDTSSWKYFLQMARAVAACRMALLVPKGINFFPESTHKVGVLDDLRMFMNSLNTFI